MRASVGLVMASLAACSTVDAADGPVASEAATFAVEEVTGGLEHPWGMAFLPDGGILVTERPGRLRLIEGGQLRRTPIEGLPEIYARRQGGLLDIALDPEFAANRLLYLAYAHEGRDGATTTRVMRARYSPEGLSEQRVIFEAQPFIDSAAHFGSRLAFGPDGTLFVTVGDRFSARQEAQSLGSHLGKVLRISRDGSVPADNPFVGRAGALPEIYTFGHRNPQGLAVHPTTGQVWEQEHGAQGGDEVNVLTPGANYGWPVVSHGTNYGGSPIGTGASAAPGMEAPLHHWTPSIAPSGMTFYTGGKFPGWQGDLLNGALKYQLVSRLDLDEAGRVVREERLLEGELGRIRDVDQGPDGHVYILTDQDDGGLYRLVPANEAG